jgi:hypothetical protein
VSRRLAIAILALLSLQFAALSLYEAWNDSLTADEATYMATGLATLQEGELRLNTDAPFFPKAIHAIPMRLTGVDVPLDGVWAESDAIDRDSFLAFGQFADDFAGLHARAGHLQRVVFLGRLIPVLEGILIGWTLYALGASLFSRSAGLLAGGLWLTTPFAVGLAHVDGLDLPFTLAVVAAALALVRHLRDPSWRTLAVLGLAAGGLQLARHTGLLYVAVICVALGVQRWRDKRAAARDIAVVLVATWALVWVAIIAVAPTRTPVDHAEVESLHAEIGGSEKGVVADAVSSAVDLIPWPADYEAGFQTQLAFSSDRLPGFLLGHAWQGARPSFWPLAMLVKLPITVVAVMLLGPLGWRWVDSDKRRLAVLAVVLPTVATFAFLLPYPKAVGLRYALPGIATLLVVASPLALAFMRHRLGRIALAMGAVAQLLFLWSSVPHSLAWTAPPFRPGYRVVSESNLDWGQDGYRLADWMDGRTAHVAYAPGWEGLIDELPGYRPLLDAPPEELTGWVAVSATLLTSPVEPAAAFGRRDNTLAWLRAYCNVGTIGGTILIYRFDVPPSLEPGPSAPAGRCDGPISQRT